MIYNDFQNISLSRLGFGTMRLPTLADGSIDEAQTFDMVDYAIKSGVNYFDTAWPYHGGMSEIVVGKALARYPRQSFYLATKYPGHQTASTYDPAAVFEKQLEKCGVDYFDFYMLHNLNDSSYSVYTDPKWGIVDYFVEQRKLGRIKHLGVSSHASLDVLEKFMDKYGDEMEFVQIQLNYLDWTLQQGKEKYELLEKLNKPIIIMEPIRGGRLASLSDGENARLAAVRPDEKAPAWALRFLQNLPQIKVILSGMSNMEQMKENIETFSSGKSLDDSETALLFDIAEGMKNSVPCTACRYCCEGCPVGIDIPKMLSIYNELRFGTTNMSISMTLESIDEDKLPDKCIGCGACSHSCPQSIDIPAAMADLAERVEKLPKWSEICRQREEAAKKLAAQGK